MGLVYTVHGFFATKPLLWPPVVVPYLVNVLCFAKPPIATVCFYGDFSW